MSVKLQRLESQMLREISDVIRNDVKNKDLMLVSITEVILTKDLNVAKIYFTCLGGDSKQEADLKALNSAKGFIRTQLGKRMQIRKIPDLNFIYDNRSDIRNEFEKVLKKIK